MDGSHLSVHAFFIKKAETLFIWTNGTNYGILVYINYREQ